MTHTSSFAGFTERYEEYKEKCTERGEIPYCYEAWLDNVVMPAAEELAKALDEKLERDIGHEE